jgi:hypothetical protein
VEIGRLVAQPLDAASLDRARLVRRARRGDLFRVGEIDLVHDQRRRNALLHARAQDPIGAVRAEPGVFIEPTTSS